MPKTLRVIATLAAASGLPTLSHAQSSVTIYGILDATVRYASHAGAGGGHLYSLNDASFTGSRLGFRGTEDLGGGMKAFFSLEQGLDPSSGTMMQATATANYGQAVTTGGRVFGREALVGLTAGTAGTVTLGRQYTFAHVLSSRFQPFGNPNQDSLAMLSGHHVARQDNMAKYAADVGPVNIGVSKTFGEGTNGAAWGLAASYKGGPIELMAYSSNMDSFNGAETRKIRGLGGTYEVTSTFKAYLGAMKRTQRVSLQVNDVWIGALSYTVNPFVFTVSYSEDKQRKVAEGSRKLAWVSVNYLFSKRTDAYVEVDNNKLTGAYPLPAFMTKRDSQEGVSVGLRHRF